MMNKSYNELKYLKTWESRLEYLKLNGNVGEDTFGFDRYFNQMFYKSKEWKRIRQSVILRDNGCDLGIEGHEILDKNYLVVHHIDPITMDDIRNSSPKLLDPNNLITMTSDTHRIIHYNHGDIATELIGQERHKNDTSPWRKQNE